MAIDDKFGKDDFSDKDFSATKWWPIERQVDAIEMKIWLDKAYKIIDNKPHTARKQKLYDQIIDMEKYYHVYTGQHYKRSKQ